jgi:MFS family permease
MTHRHPSHGSDSQAERLDGATHSRQPSLLAKVLAPFGLDRSQDQPFSWRTLRHRQFALYWAGSVSSDFGTWLQNTAQVILAYRLAHSAFAVGLVTCAQFSSPLVLGPWAGVMADRFGGRRTLLGTQIMSAALAFALAALQFCGALSEWWLVAGALLSGLSFTFALPARNVIVRRLVPEEETRPAYVMDAVSYNLGRLAAPPASVFFGSLVGYQWMFVANGLTFILFTITLMRARPDTPEPEVRSRVRDGFVLAGQNRLILFLLLMVAAVTVADDPVLVLGPTLTSKLHASPDWSGLFIAALGAGSVVGSLRRPRHPPSRRLAATALACLGVCMVCFVSVPSVWGSLIAALGAGVCCLLANSMARTLLAKTAAPDQAGAVMAIFAIAWAGSKPLASLTDGLFAAHLGVQRTGIIFAIPAFVPLAYLLVKRFLAASGPAIQLALAKLTAGYRSFASSVLTAPSLVSARLQVLRYARHGSGLAIAQSYDVALTHSSMVECSPEFVPISAYEQYAERYAFEPERGDRWRPRKARLAS